MVLSGSLPLDTADLNTDLDTAAAIRNSSGAAKERASINKVWKVLKENGYPDKVLRRLLKEVKRKHVSARPNVARRDEGGALFLCLPYVDEKLLCQIQSKVRKSGLNVRLAWRNPKKLRNQLIRSSLSKPKCPGGLRCHTCASGFAGDCTQKNVVYCLHCKLCEEQGKPSSYIGETKSPVRLRFNEHLRDATNETEGTPMGDHIRECHSGATAGSIRFRIQILHRARDHPDRKIAESLLIRRDNPALNSNVSSWPIL